MPARGSITRIEGKRGVSYRARLTVGKRADGSPDTKSKTFTHKKLADAWLNDLAQRVQSGAYVQASPMTLHDLCDRWLNLADPRRGDHTRNHYREALRLHVLPHLGGLRVGDLTTLMLQDHFDARAAAGVGKGMLERTRVALSGALKQAVDWRVRPDNPLAGVRVGYRAPSARTVWSPADLRAFLAFVRDDPEWGALFGLLAMTGLRKGEALALDWSDVDLDGASVTVRRTVTEDRRSRPVLGAGAKTKAGMRTVALTLPAVAVLRAHRERWLVQRAKQGDLWHEHLGELVFHQGDGALRHPTSPNKALEKLCARMGVPRLTPHGLRHTFATTCLELGIHPKIVSEMLGHKDIQTTLNTYSHVNLDLQKQALAAIGRAFGEGEIVLLEDRRAERAAGAGS
jgi:integrase